MTPQDWIGRSEHVTETVTPFPAQAMSATLNRPGAFQPGTPLPPLWHWFHALKIFPLSDAGHDGHEALGHFLPPQSLPRRMWAGSRFTFHAPVTIGATVTRTSTIEAVTEKQGRAGPICFVSVRHLWSEGAQALIDEVQDIVYRTADAPPGAVQPATDSAQIHREMRADPVLLFRYSALTFNGHRIHYDRDFCTAEGYGGLVVHGPLLATLLLDLLRCEGGRLPADFRFRALAPITVDTPFTLMADLDGDSADLWVRRHDGALAMKASATLAPLSIG
jgi:3-methylfumaryl-CoA hydratase